MRTWNDNIADVAKGLYHDEELKTMMLIPEKDFNNIVAFRDKYCVNTVLSDEILKSENVVIIYRDEDPEESNSQNVMYHRLYFDIYVKRDQSYTYGDDRMISRGKAIATKLHHLICKTNWGNIKFACRGIYDMTSKTEGYDRVTVVFRYKRIYV